MNSMIEITKKTADLALLSLSDEELSSFSRDMDSIYRFAEQMTSAGSKEQVTEVRQAPLRHDVAESFEDGAALVAAAPEGSMIDGCFTVPKAVD